MRVLVTGATGFVGGRLVERLGEAGHFVRALVRTSSAAQRRTALSERGAVLVEGNLHDEQSLMRALDTMDAVVHCAGHVQDYGPRHFFYQANVVGTSKLVGAASHQVGKMIHISTTDVYGYPHALQIAEDHPVRPCNYYNETKLLGEQIVVAAEGLEVTVLRPASIYGPGSYSIVVEFLQQVKSGFFPFFRSKGIIAGLTHVDNLCDAILLALQRSHSSPQVFNLTDGSPVTWEEFVDALAELALVKPKKMVLPYPVGYAAGVAMEYANMVMKGKRRPLLTRMAVQLLGNHQDFSIKKATRELLYQPRCEFEVGMDQTATWLREAGLL